jgi:uroporphyrinogen III methyltransferase/synthase
MTAMYPVALVGAGPGHPGLLTLRAAELLRDADLVLYDRLVNPALLAHAPRARHLCVDELPGEHPHRWPHIHAALIDAARRGGRVVRLKGGDPMVFGRGAEEAQALREAGVPFEVVPGVTAGLGATAFAGIPVTHREYASAVALVTGHDCAGSRLDWAALARFPGTLVFYMGVAKLPTLVQALTLNGMDPDTPAAAIQQGTTPAQRTVTAPLRDLPSAAAGIAAPAVIVVGKVVSLRETLAWFESLPLFGKRVLITRPRQQAAGMARMVVERGGEPVLLPVVDVAPPEDWSAVDAAIARLDQMQWLVFTSANGVEAFLGRILKSGHDLRVLGGVKLAAIGPATAEALRAYHLEPDVVPDVYNSEGLAEALVDRVRGQRVLLARADRGIDLLRDELGGVAEVEQVAVYRQVDAVSNDDPALGMLSRGEIDLVALTSSNIAVGFAAALNNEARRHVMEGRTRLVAISPRTAAAAQGAGLPVAAVAEAYTAEGVLEAMGRLVR